VRQGAVTGKRPDPGDKREVSYHGPDPAGSPVCAASARHDWGMADKQLTNAEARSRITELVKESRTCMLTTIADDGRQVSRPMGLQESEFDGVLWFFSLADSGKAQQIQAQPEVNVAFANPKGNTWVSIAGAATREFDKGKAALLWTPFLEPWFPDGIETPGLTLIRVQARTAAFWDSSGLMGQAKAAMTGKAHPPRHHLVDYP
jgi:general stress protein 26